MPENQEQLIYSIASKPGIKRDGTILDAEEFTDGVWCRFQRGVPKKMGGYREMYLEPNGIPRGIISNAYNGINYVFTGTTSTLDVFTSSTTLGTGTGPFVSNIQGPVVTAGSYLIGGSGYTNGTYTGVSLTGGSGSGAQATIIVSGGAVTSVTITNGGTNYVIGDILSAAASSIGGTGSGFLILFTQVASFTPDSRNLWQFDMLYSPSGGNLQVLAHPGLNLDHIDNAIKSPVLIGNLLPTAGKWTFSELADTGGQHPTNLPISVDGGVCVLYPFIFVYGSNGFIANNNVDSTYASQGPTDWNGPLANQVNMSAGKIVKGMPVRGGTNAPSGLFWATDSLIRVSFTGQTGLEWRYDIISSQVSILSSSSVVEMDGVYYWAGTDRFYQYNGAVTVVPNDKNINWFYNNLNFTQRQKVWATKVPRYNEIWFFYPRGDATECTDAIIFNVKDQIWYDAGQAEGARRSCGYPTEVFPAPIWCGWEYENQTGNDYNIVATPSGMTAPTPYQVYVAGDATPSLSPGIRVSFNTTGQPFYTVLSSVFTFNSTTESTGGVTLITMSAPITDTITTGNPIYQVNNGYGIWQHEYGLNKITLNAEIAIFSSFTTRNLSWVSGGPSQVSAQGLNRRLHLRRVEPDFVQGGMMSLNIIGIPFAQNNSNVEEISGPFEFDPTTGKIDLRVEYREARLQFESNDIDGNFEMGRILITAEPGDERP